VAEIIDEHEAARRLGMEVREVVYRLDYGQMMGVKASDGWKIDTRDLEFFAHGEAFGDEVARSCKAPVGAEDITAFEDVDTDSSPGWRHNPEYEIELEIVPAEVSVTCGGVAIVRTTRALLVMELGHGPVYYLPRDDVDWSLFKRTDHGSYCQYKGFARYWTLTVGDRVEKNVMWDYDEPHKEVARLRDYVGVYWHRMDAWFEDGEPVDQPRDIRGRCNARNSFRALYPELAREWHPEKNPNIWPYECAPWFRVVVWWRNEAGREWQQSVRDRVLGRPISS
tara:strand:+ start:7819 stop:8661 length:843 start_codon:yes stop_codon:yes gene_type:complete